MFIEREGIRIVQVKALISKWVKNSSGSEISWAERAGQWLSGIVLLCILYWVFLIVTTPFYVKQMKESVPQTHLDQMKSLPPLEEFSYYQNIISEHPVFGVIKQASNAPTRSACDEFKAKYALAGIIGGAENEALFNSKGGNQTHISKSGEVLEGVTIESVGAHSVSLNCSGQSVEMVIEET